MAVKSVSWLRMRVTRLYSRYGFGKIEEISEYSVLGISRDVYWFDSDSKMAGHCTPFNTILMNKQPFRELSETTRDYVFLHEVGHANLSLPATILVYAVLVPTLISAIVSPFAAIQQVIVVWWTTNSLELTLMALLAGLIVMFLLTGLFSLASWLSEAHAELYALKKLGIDVYLEASEEIRVYAERSFIRRILHRIRYPPPRLVVWISKKI